MRDLGAREETQSLWGVSTRGRAHRLRITPAEAEPEKSGLSGWGLHDSPRLCCPRLPGLAASLGLLEMLSLSLCHLRFPLCEARSTDPQELAAADSRIFFGSGWLNFSRGSSVWRESRVQ